MIDVEDDWMSNDVELKVIGIAIEWNKITKKPIPKNRTVMVCNNNTRDMDFVFWSAQDGFNDHKLLSSNGRRYKVSSFTHWSEKPALPGA